MNRRRFLSKTAGAAVGLAAAFPARARAQKSPNDTVNVAIIGLRGDNKRFVGDEEADRLLGRTDRAPYLLPEKS
jgi:uncharacterized protein (DUF1501 family)